MLGENYKIGFCFQINEGLEKPKLWKKYFENAYEYEVLVHPWKSPFRNEDFETIPFSLVPHRTNSWEQTLQIHLEFFKQAKEKGLKKIVLLSESCIPIRPYKEFFDFCSMGYSYLNGLKDIWWRPENVKRVIQPELRKFALAHEQWWCLDIEHYTSLLENEKYIIKMFQRSFADNEYYLGTMLNKLGYLNDILNYPIHHIRWPEKSRHPITHSVIDNTMEIDEKSFFLRKINKETTINREFNI